MIRDSGSRVWVSWSQEKSRAEVVIPSGDEALLRKSPLFGRQLL